jgi:hypothetical protein
MEMMDLRRRPRPVVIYTGEIHCECIIILVSLQFSSH